MLRSPGEPSRFGGWPHWFQFKIAQEVITLTVFIVFAVFSLREKLAWNHLVAFGLLAAAAFFAFAFKSGVSSP